MNKQLPAFKLAAAFSASNTGLLIAVDSAFDVGWLETII